MLMLEILDTRFMIIKLISPPLPYLLSTQPISPSIVVLIILYHACLQPTTQSFAVFYQNNPIDDNWTNVVKPYLKGLDPDNPFTVTCPDLFTCEGNFIPKVLLLWRLQVANVYEFDPRIFHFRMNESVRNIL